MRKAIMILGTILIAAVILISGSAVGAWFYAFYIDSQDNCTYASRILYSPDGRIATIGTDSGNGTLGEIVLDLGEQTGMINGQEFTVYASSSIEETYKIRLISSLGRITAWWTDRDDTTNEDFTAPSNLTEWEVWRYYEIHSEEGSFGLDPYGSDIDAVGYNQG